MALERGVDDLVHVPFTPDEIVVRTIASLRRATGRAVIGLGDGEAAAQ